jgi:hypothetical protein
VGANEQPRRPAALGRALVAAVRQFVDEILLFTLFDIALLGVVFAALLVVVGVPILVIAAPVFCLPLGALMRLAVASSRDRVISWGMAGAELRRLPGRKLALATVQLLILGLGAANLALAPALGGLVGIGSAAVAGYAVVASSVYAVALWPIVCDPDQERPLRDQLRLALAVMLLRPIQLLVLAVIAGLAVAASAISLQLVIPAIVLPALVLLAVANYVTPVADSIRLRD